MRKNVDILSGGCVPTVNLLYQLLPWSLMIDFFNWSTVWLSKISMAKGSVSSKLAIQQHSVTSVEDIVGGFELIA